MSSIGIDLGTTNSAASTLIGDREEILDIEGDRTIRSVVSFEPGDNEVIVGNMAADLMERHPDLTVSSIKRHMVDDDYTVTIDDDSYEMTEYAPEEISALVLKKVLAGAEGSLGEEPDGAVITVPADFPENARAATRRAGELVGVDVLRLLPEPSAACVAYGLRDRDEDIERVAVYDLGGGTFDISLVDVAHEDGFYDVVATEGEQELGGDDFDEALAEWIAEQIEDETGADVTEDRGTYLQLKGRAKEIKEQLSSRNTATFRDSGTLSGENVDIDISREQFEEITGHLVDRTIEFSETALESQDMSPEDVDTVLLVGGSTKIPAVKQAVEEFFGQEPSQEVNPDEAVAIGAGVFADSIDPKKALEGDEDDEDRSGLPSDVRVSNVVPDDLGIELASGKIDTIIESNSNLPTMERKEREYTTVEDNQTRALIKLYQGEGDTVDDGDLELKTEFVLENIREAPANEPEITVQVKLDEDGVLSAHAWDESVVGSEVIDPGDADGVADGEAHIDMTPSGDEDKLSVEEIRALLPEIA
jgi:molecular chaperone DnaK